MTPSIDAFLALSLTLAGVVGCYLASIRYVVRRGGAARPSWMALPFVAPLRTWQLGEHRLPIALGATTVLYVLLLVVTRLAGSL